ncbi:alpha/beta fold hydrolase [Pseudonocardia sichuanensis]
MSELEHHHARLDGVDLHYVTAGQGTPLVLLHGWPQTWYCWRKVIPLLITDHLVVAPDLRGLGDSSRPSTGYDKRTVAADVDRLMREALGIERFHVVGHDWGGVVGYALAAHFPEPVKSLTVVDVAIPGDGRPDISQGGRRWHHGFHRIADLPEALVAGREEQYLGWFYDNYGNSGDVISDADRREYLRTYTQPEALKAGFAYYRALDTDIAHNVARAQEFALSIPVLAVGGAGGWGRGSEVADSIRRLATDVREVVVEGTGHWIPEEQPEVLVEHVRALLATTGPLGAETR